MQSMKMTKAEAKTYLGGPTEPGDAPAYPYGLTLYLDDDTLKKLGIAETPAVGTEMLLQARVVVTSCGMNQEQDGDKKSRCDLQITDMELHDGKPKGAAAMYAKSGMK